MVLNISEAIDPDGDELNYTINWGDGSGWVEWIVGDPATHRYSSPGTYRISVDVTDHWGYQQNLGSNISIIDRQVSDDDDDDDDDTKNKEKDGTLSAIIAAITIVIILVLIGFIFIMVRSKDDDEEYYDDGEPDPLESALADSMEE